MRLSLFLCLSILFMASFAQKPEDYGIKSKKALKFYLDGRTQMQQRDYAGAINSFKEAIKLEPEFGDANYFVGESLWKKERFQEAIPYLDVAQKSTRAGEFGTLNAILGDCYFMSSRYGEAVACYEKFVQNPKGLKIYLDNAQRNLPRAKFAAEAIQNPVKFAPVNLGANINSPDRDYLPFLTADDRTLLWTSHRPETTGGYNQQHRDYPEDIYMSEFKEGEWQPAVNLGPPINTADYEGAASITQDGKIVFFAADYPTGLGSYDLYFSIFANGKWTKPENMGPNVNSSGWDSQPFLAPDGKTLYFSSRRPGGVGEKDIWMCKWENGKWSKAECLKAPINSTGNEQCPFIHADGRTMYFSSDQHPGFGGDDLFVAYYDERTGWSQPQNMGYPLNTAAHEGNIFVNTKGTRGFINSDRPGGFGKDDLYEFVLDERYRPQISTFLRGITKDTLSKKPVPARIKLVDVVTNDTVRTIFSGKTDGKFLMSLPMNREYAAFAEAPGYIFTSKNFYLKDLPEDIYFDITIDMIPIPAKPAPTASTPTPEPIKPETPIVVVLNNIFFTTGSFELKKESYLELNLLLSYLYKNPRMKIEIQGHTDNVGAAQTNLTLSENRANAVRNYLISQGIGIDRVTAVGFGETQPIDSNDTAQGRARNRRTAFRIIEL